MKIDTFDKAKKIKNLIDTNQVYVNNLLNIKGDREYDFNIHAGPRSNKCLTFSCDDPIKEELLDVMIIYFETKIEYLKKEFEAL